MIAGPAYSSGGTPLPSVVDPTRPSIARVYDACLGGKDNYEADRAILDQLHAFAPEVEPLAHENRAFLLRVTRFLAARVGIDQFLDLGSGLPTVENTHQVAQRIRPDARVVYVDNDPSVVAYGRALLEDNEQTRFVPADIFAPETVLEDPTVREHLDLSRPLALFQLMTLHHLSGPPSPAEVMARYIDALPSGSYVAVSHFLDPEDEHTDLARRIEAVFHQSMMGVGHFRTRAEIGALMPGLELLPPGVTQCVDWWPDGPRLSPLVPAQHCIAGVVGRKP